MESNIQEIAELSPFKLGEKIQIGDLTIHTNKKIIDYVIDWVSSSAYSRPIYKKIINGILKKKIIIGYENKSIMKFLFMRLRKFRNPSYGNNVLGFFSPEDEKLIILLDENVDVFGKSIREIPPIINH